MGKNQHVVPANGEWGVRGEGNSRLTSVHDTQERQLMQRARLPLISVQRWSYIAQTVEFVTKTVTAMTRCPHEIASISLFERSLPSHQLMPKRSVVLG
jgi:Uncharacterized protein conserved in bacteria (DUF2188)